MPAIANLALQNNAAAAVVGTALVPSSGDTSPAVWRVETAKPPFARPILQMSSKWNTKRTARHVDVKISVPYTVNNTATLQEEPVANLLYVASYTFPSNVPTSVSDDFIAYCKTFGTDAGVNACLKAAYAPT